MIAKQPIYSTLHSNLIVRPIAFWVFINFIALCACAATEKNESYHYRTFFTFLLFSTPGIFFIAYVVILRKEKLKIENDVLSYTSFSGKVKRSYALSNLVDFKWHNSPVVSQSRGYVSKVSLKNENIELFFNDGQELSIDFDAFGNFDDIKKFLFDYSIRHGIIYLEPLEARKRRH